MAGIMIQLSCPNIECETEAEILCFRIFAFVLNDVRGYENCATRISWALCGFEVMRWRP